MEERTFDSLRERERTHTHTHILTTLINHYEPKMTTIGPWTTVVLLFAHKPLTVGVSNTIRQTLFSSATGSEATPTGSDVILPACTDNHNFQLSLAG